MKIHILFKLKAGPYGGGNQFLKALKQALTSRGAYEPNPLKADILLANANPGNLRRLSFQLSLLNRLCKSIPVIMRVDGPISLIRGTNASQAIDNLTGNLVHKYAAGIIFQSNWSQAANSKIFSTSNIPATVIHNAADPSIFYPASSKPPSQKIRLTATSWSPNHRKGFDIYQYLDQHLDFSRYNMTFVGNSPVTFKNIKHIAPQSSHDLGSLLRQHDIFITASQNDPCSNSLIEALACGLPAVVRNSGGHPELIGPGGKTFESTDDILSAIDEVASNLDRYRQNTPHHSLTKAADAYLDFFSQASAQLQSTPHDAASTAPTA